MLRPRVIPVLLVKDNGLVKSQKFTDYRYIGDPINAVRIFNEKKVDELMIIDIDATINSREPNFDTIGYWASECRMPLCYGGGIKTLNQAEKIFSLGVEKVALSSIVYSNPSLITEISKKVGAQSVVIVIDVKKSIFGKYHVYSHNGRVLVKVDLVDFVKKLEDLGAGEIVINSIDRDGKMKGYDIDLAKIIRNSTSLPLTIIGGVGAFNHIEELINEFKIIGAGVGSLFVFKGKYKAVLINYLNVEQKKQLATISSEKSVKASRNFKKE